MLMFCLKKEIIFLFTISIYKFDFLRTLYTCDVYKYFMVGIDFESIDVVVVARSRYMDFSRWSDIFNNFMIR